MANFCFEILNGRDPQDQYNSIEKKDPMTFYLLSNGVGYLGEICLFDATIDGSGSKSVVTEITTDNSTDANLASVKAIVDYVTERVSNLTFSDVLTTKFFRNVESCVLNAALMGNPNVSVPSGCNVGDVGLLFTADVDGEDNDNEKYYFVSLVEYLNNMIEFVDTPNITFTLTKQNGTTKVTPVLNYDNIYMGSDQYGLLLKATNTIEGTAKQLLVTDEAVIDYIAEVIIPRLEALETSTTEHTTVINNITPRVDTLETTVATNTEILANEVVKFNTCSS